MAGYSTRKCSACGETSKFRNDYLTCCKGKSAKKPEPVVVPPLSGNERLTLELEKLRVKKSANTAQMSALSERVLELEAEIDAMKRLSGVTPQIMDIPVRAGNKDSESAMVMVWSDWHIEEEILPEAVANRNEYNLEIMERRFQNLLHGCLAWFNIESQKTSIKNVVIAMLGDFINGSIHEDLAESNLLSPVDAIYKAQTMLISALNFMLKNTPADVNFTIVCHSGNHGRMTKKQRIATEAGNSLEQFMYYGIRDFFKSEPRLKFIVANGYHTYVRFFEGLYEIRFHHGHQINYQGGVGGITIPVNKAIAQWNRAHAVNLDVFGHFHTKFDGGNFIANGSLPGYNAYAVSIKASYEKPSQQVFLVNRQFGEKTMVAPVFVDLQPESIGRSPQ